MGIYFTDKYSLLHFVSGIVAYYWNIKFIYWFIIHAIYEAVENIPTVVKLIDNIPIWPGGKKYSDKIINRIGDQFYAILGWIFTHLYLNIIYGGYT
jgi:hypothetical protein